MPEPPPGAPPFKPYRAAYKELMEGLWYAYELFRSSEDGGVEGIKAASQAAARFIAVRHENPELAAPFLYLFQALDDLEKGIDPELFSRRGAQERSRSRFRKHLQLLTAAAVHTLMALGDSRMSAAQHVARRVNGWPAFAKQKVSGTTVLNWRDQCLRLDDPRHKQFQQLTDWMASQPDPRREVEKLLTDPPGIPGS